MFNKINQSNHWLFVFFFLCKGVVTRNWGVQLVFYPSRIFICCLPDVINFSLRRTLLSLFTCQLCAGCQPTTTSANPTMLFLGLPRPATTLMEPKLKDRAETVYSQTIWTSKEWLVSTIYFSPKVHLDIWFLQGAGCYDARSLVQGRSRSERRGGGPAILSFSRLFSSNSRILHRNNFFSQDPFVIARMTKPWCGSSSFGRDFSCVVRNFQNEMEGYYYKLVPVGVVGHSLTLDGLASLLRFVAISCTWNLRAAAMWATTTLVWILVAT